MVSTKCFTNTVVAFALLALHLGRIRDLSVTDGKRIIEGLRRLPEQISEILTMEDEIEKLAHEYAEAKSSDVSSAGCAATRWRWRRR